MDFLDVSAFEFENESYENIQKIWEVRNLWFFKIEKKEQSLYGIKLENGSFLKQRTGKNSFHKNSSEAQNFAQDAKVEGYNIVLTDYVYYLASNDKGQYIKTTNGEPVEFADYETALKMAISYNNDLIKIRSAFAMYHKK